jgi:hypothetical protein
MPILELWHWRVTDPASGCRYVTRHPMTEASALSFDQEATRAGKLGTQALVALDTQSRVRGKPLTWAAAALGSAHTSLVFHTGATA